MKLKSGRLIAGVALASLGTLASASAYAQSFTPSIDELWINKNGSEVFRDSFNGVLPLSTGTYSYSPGFTSESGGRLTMTPALGNPTIINPTGTATFTGALLKPGLSSTDPGFIGYPDSFEIHALYDMSSLPPINGASFGIRATDQSPSSIGNDTVQLAVGKSATTGNIVVSLRDINFSLGTSTPISSRSINSFLASATQVDLMLAKAAGSDMVGASYVLYGSSGILDQWSFAAQLKIYEGGETFTRAQFFSTTINPVPEPETYAMLLAGLGLLGFAARGRELKEAAVA